MSIIDHVSYASSGSIIRTFHTLYSHIIHDSLYRNSLYLMGSTVITAIFGFIFWIITARLVAPAHIGIATAMISAGALITQCSLLGLKEGIIRFLPGSSSKNAMINTVFQIHVVFSIIICAVFLLLLPYIAPKLLFLHDTVWHLFIFTLLVTSFSINQIQEGIFVAYRSSGYVVVKNALWGMVKVLVPFFSYTLGADGIFIAFSSGSVVSMVFGLYVLIRRFGYTCSLEIRQTVIRKIGKFSLGNFLGWFLTALPSLILPLVIIQMIGVEQSAYYYIDLQIAGLLYIIPLAATQSLFAESSHNEEEIKKHVKKTIGLICLLLIPAILLTVLLGGFLLNIFGPLYAQNGRSFLQLLAVSGIFVSVNFLGSAVVNIQQKVHIFVVLSGISAALVMLFSILFAGYHLDGIGYALLIGRGSTAIVYGVLLYRMLR